MELIALRTRGRAPLAVLVAAILVALLTNLVATESRAADPSSSATALAAVNWIKTQQQSDGSFEVAGFPGFETPDAVEAIAEQAQTGTTWNTSQALGAVSNIKYGGSGPTPLDALDDLAESTPTAGQAAKLIVLDLLPLGLNPADFDPSGDSAAPVNLIAAIDSGCGSNTASFGAFNATLYAMLAKWKICGVVPPAAVTTVRSAQQANGGWNFVGDPSGTDVDVDTTSLALQALAAAGANATDSTVARAMIMLAGAQNSNGSWNSPFSSNDPNSTAMGVLAVVAAGFDPNSRCWRDSFAPSRSGDPYNSPDAWTRSQQAGDGHIVSPNDGWGVNTFATSQSVESLLRMWLPLSRAPATLCIPQTTSSTVSASASSTGDPQDSATSGSTQIASSTPSTAATPVSGNPKYAG